jgi:hypothetical protein
VGDAVHEDQRIARTVAFERKHRCLLVAHREERLPTDVMCLTSAGHSDVTQVTPGNLVTWVTE